MLIHTRSRKMKSSFLFNYPVIISSYTNLAVYEQFYRKSTLGGYKKNKKFFLVLFFKQKMRQMSNQRLKQSCGTVVTAPKFFLWKFNGEKMDEKLPAIIVKCTNFQSFLIISIVRYSGKILNSG